MSNNGPDLTIHSSSNDPANRAAKIAMMERLAAKKDALEAQRETQMSTTMEASATTEISTTVESPTIETAAKPVATVTEQQATNEFHRLWVKHDSDLSMNRAGSEDLAKKQQERLREFLIEAFSQAQELIKPENRDLLNKLIRDKMLVSPKATDSGLLIQIAALQIGQTKKGEFKTPARREERYGLLYRIFAEKGWTAAKLNTEIVLAGGTSKIIEADKLARRKASGIVEKRASAMKEAYADDRSPSIKVYDAMRSDVGKWRLALVSIHEDGEVRVRSLVGKANDAATVRAVESYADTALAIREGVAMNSSPASPTDDRAAA